MSARLIERASGRGTDNSALGDKGFVGLLGGELLGSFDGKLDGRLLRHAIDADKALVLAAAGVPLNKAAHHLEGDFAAVFLAPVDEFALEVPVGGGDGFDIEVRAEDSERGA